MGSRIAPDLVRRLASCAVFDLDGTLIDTAPTLEWAINEALQEAGLPTLARTTVRGCIGHGPVAFVGRALALLLGSTADEAVMNQVSAGFGERLMSEPLRDATIRPGARRALAAIRSRGGAVGVCTNKPELLAGRVLGEAGFGGLVDRVVGGDTLSTRKPAPQPLWHCIAELGHDRTDAVFVGDSSVDLDAGRAAGVPVMLIAGGYEPGSLVAEPDARFDRFDELIDVLQQPRVRT